MAPSRASREAEGRVPYGTRAVRGDLRRPGARLWLEPGLAGATVRDAIEAQRVRFVAVSTGAADVLAADLGPVLDHVHEGHRMAAADAEVLLEPLDDRSGLGLGRVESLLPRQRDELVRVLPVLASMLSR
jgi:hypothetical protein